MAQVNYGEIGGHLGLREGNKLNEKGSSHMGMTGEHKNDCNTSENNASTLNVSAVWV